MGVSNRARQIRPQIPPYRYRTIQRPVFFLGGSILFISIEGFFGGLAQLIIASGSRLIYDRSSSYSSYAQRDGKNGATAGTSSLIVSYSRPQLQPMAIWPTPSSFSFFFVLFAEILWGGKRHPVTPAHKPQDRIIFNASNTHITAGTQHKKNSLL